MIFAKNSRNYKFQTIKPHKECSVDGNTRFKPLTTLLPTDGVVWAAEQVGQRKTDTRVDNFTYTWTRPQ